jgi:hypothetical protein
VTGTTQELCFIRQALASARGLDPAIKQLEDWHLLRGHAQ